MVTRNDILSKAADDCMKELYSLAQPHVEWEDFQQQCKEYSKKYQALRESKDENKDYRKLGPKPYEFYYIPSNIMKDVVDSYVEAYRINKQEELLSTIRILKQYIQDPIEDIYVKDENEIGQREYQHAMPLKNVILNITCDKKMTDEIYQKIEEYLDKAGKFYNWNTELNSFGMTVYLGVSPCSNKERVIENWKKHKGVDITIDDEAYKEEYYDED